MPASTSTRSIPERTRTLPLIIGNTISKTSETDSQGAASTSYAIADASPVQASHKPQFRSSLKKSHKRVTADAQPLTPSEERSSDQDGQAASLKAATVPEGSFVSLSSFKPSNPFAKKIDAKQNADDKNDSLLQSLKKMKTCEPEIKRKGGDSTQQRPGKMGMVV